MQFRRIVWLVVVLAALLLVGAVSGMLIWRYPEIVGIRPGSVGQTIGLWLSAVMTFLLMAFLMAYHFLGHQLGRSAYRRQVADDLLLPEQAVVTQRLDAQSAQCVDRLKKHLQARYGFFWRRRVRLMLVVGEPDHIEAIAPNLGVQVL